MKRSKALASLRAFLSEQDDIIQIVKLCHLFPMKDSWRKWTDHLGNFFQVHNNKKVISFEHHPEEIKDIKVTDVFYKSHPKKIAKISKHAFIAIGKDDQDNQIVFIWFLGQDDRLRLVTSCNGEWIRNYSPMICGVETLRPIVRSLSEEKLTRVPILRVAETVAAQISKSWSTPWPLLEENTEIKQALGEIYETK